MLRANKVVVNPQISAIHYVLRCILIRKDCADISARAGNIFVLEMGVVWFAPSFGVKNPYLIFFFFLSTASFYTCVKCRVHQKRVLYLIHLKCWVCDSLIVFS